MKTHKRLLQRLLSNNEGLSFGEQEKIEITGKGKNRSVLIESVKKILLYGREEMVFLRSDGRVCIRGRELDCVSYVSGAIGISGEIQMLMFQKGDAE